MSPVSRIVLFGFDGLRPDLVSASTMPHLHGFMAGAAVFANARSVFPSETRVAIPSLSTGCLPGTHGLVANSLYDAQAAPDRILNTKHARDIDLLTEAHGRLLGVPSLGAHLHTHGRSFDVLWTGTLGAARAMFPEAGDLGAFRWHPEDQTRAAQGLEARFGAVPAAAVPAVDRVRHGARIFVEHVLEERRPQVAIFWSSEPDISYHYRGVGSDDARHAMGVADACFAQVLAWRERQPDRDSIVLIALSDHGHITGERRIDLAAAMREGGFAVAREFGGDARFALGGGGAPGLWQREPDHAATCRMAEWLARQPWVSLVLSRDGDVAGTLPLAVVGARHARSPDLAFTLRGSDAPDDHGMPGRGLIELADIPVGGGMHGGLHLRELANVMAIAGGPVTASGQLQGPANLTDVAPTVLRLLGLPAAQMDGSVLSSAWGETADHPPVRTTLRGGRTPLSMFKVGEQLRPDRLLEA